MSAFLAKEFRAFGRSGVPGVSISLPGDSMSVWRFEVSADAFDASLPQMKTLRADLERLAQATGHPDAIIMEASFPGDFPSRPFLLRVVSPRMKYLTGHVTAGGSICIEALTLSGSPGSWQPSFKVEGILTMVLHNMATAESVIVQTATGPGGRSGPLAINMSRGPAYAASPYSLQDAQSAYQRTLENHKWGGSGSGAAPRQPLQPIAVPAAPPKQPAPAPAPQLKAQPPAPAPVPVLQVQAQPAAPVPAPVPAAAPQPAIAPLAAVLPQQRTYGAPHSGATTSTAFPAPTALARPAAPVRNAAAPAPAPPNPRKRPAPEEVDLSALSDDEDEDGGGQGPVAAAKPESPPLMKRLKEANRATDLDLLLPPSTWKTTDEVLKGELAFVALPLPAGHPNAAGSAAAPPSGANAAPYDTRHLVTLKNNGLSEAAATAALAAAGGDVGAVLAALLDDSDAKECVKESAVAEIMLNGVGRADAEAALRARGGNVERALLYIMRCNSKGVAPSEASFGAAGHRRKRQRVEQVAAAAAAKVAAAQREVEGVLERFAAHSGIAASRIISIERVQNLVLWTEYQRLKAKVFRAGAGGANEQRLWHGAERSVVADICREGFDIRVSNSNGSLGMGTYFAQSSLYSDGYSRAPRRTAGGGAPAAAANPPGPTPSFVQGGFSMLLCDVALGKSMPGRTGVRRPDPGFHSATTITAGDHIWAVYENAQCFPAYCVHYK